MFRLLQGLRSRIGKLECRRGDEDVCPAQRWRAACETLKRPFERLADASAYVCAPIGPASYTTTNYFTRLNLTQ